MIKCVNVRCMNDADNPNSILVSPDGDFACSKNCKKEFEKQRSEFFENIGNDDWYNNWLNK